MSRRTFLRNAGALGAASALGSLTQPASAQPQKVFRYAFPVAETGFDPAQISDLYSRTIARNIFDSPLRFDYLARPSKLKLSVAASLPESSEDFRTHTVRLRPGIFFQDDPAFKGKRRELTAADFVYSWKRHFDPRWKSLVISSLESLKILGTRELRAEAVKTGRFDYEREIEGLRALDRYTLQFKLEEPDPRFAYNLTDSSQLGAVAREVVELYGDRIMEHPVGSGPYRLVDWRRSSRIVLERNPGYRDEFYDEEPPADDARSQSIAASFKGRKLPIIDRIEVYIIEESQPRWLAFLNAEHDMLEGIPPEFAQIVIPNNQLAPNLVKKRIEMDRIPLVDIVVSYFNMEHPLIGGYTPDKIALRRAISLAYDNEQEIRLIRKNQMIPAHSVAPPLTFGYVTDFLSDTATFDLARAKALLDTYGYVDRDGDGWREMPDGSVLELDYATQSDSLSKQYNELWKKCMDAVGIRMKFSYAQWPEQLKQSRAGKLMIWGVGWSGVVPDSETFFSLGYGPQKGANNRSRFDLPAYNALYDRQRVLPDGPERLAVMHEMKRYFATFMPYKLHGHRIRTDLTQPWVIGYRRHPFMRDFFKFIDVDPAAQSANRS